MLSQGEIERALRVLDEDFQRRAVWVDGGPTLMSHAQMHRYHGDEPYLGCVFCRDRFVLADAPHQLLLEVSDALDGDPGDVALSPLRDRIDEYVRQHIRQVVK